MVITYVGSQSVRAAAHIAQSVRAGGWPSLLTVFVVCGTTKPTCTPTSIRSAYIVGSFSRACIIIIVIIILDVLLWLLFFNIS